MNSTIPIGDDFSLVRGDNDKGMEAYLENHCNKCGWVGQKHYAYNNYQHSNCREERILHRKKCAYNASLPANVSTT